MISKSNITKAASGGLIICWLAALSGCPLLPPSDDSEYMAGFIAGFAEDDEYWDGYFDSYLTVPDGPILYTGSEIPYVTEPPYEAGYWDGVWYAYNDGYFVSYDYAFTIGFSEGYDLAYYPDWYAFLSRDAHAEYFDGSFADGYEDGFSEGRIFGAVDYMLGLSFDWLDAMWDYRDGTDLYIEELDVGTGLYGPVYLYEYGVDPHDYYQKSLIPGAGTSLIRRSRGTAGADSVSSPRAPFAVRTEARGIEKSVDENDYSLSYRELRADAKEELDRSPVVSARDPERELRLSDTWLDRVNAYRAER